MIIALLPEFFFLKRMHLVVNKQSANKNKTVYLAFELMIIYNYTNTYLR